MELKHAAVMALTAAGLPRGGRLRSELKKAQVNVAQIADLLPGRYNNRAQAEADAKAGNPEHDAKTIDIVRVSHAAAQQLRVLRAGKTRWRRWGRSCRSVSTRSKR